MSRLLNTGISSLAANQAALQTTGHNIANVNTAGYSRQTVALRTVTPQNMGNGYIGNGVSVATITRNFSELLNKQSNAANALSSADASRYQSLMQMQDVFSGGDSSLGQAINAMMNAFADVESAPADSTARNVVLTRISELTARFRSASGMLEEQDYSTKQQITNNVVLVNSLAGQVATLNGQISRSLATGHTPNDLLDARDQLIREINSYVKTSQVDADDGSVSLFVGGSQPLVLGTSSGQLSLDITEEYPGSGKLSLYFSHPGGEKVELTASVVGGGEIAGLLKFNNDDLVNGRNLLGRLALAIGDALNSQNQRGLTLSGAQGGDLFKLSLTTVGSSLPSMGIAVGGATATVTDSTKLVASDYKLVFGTNHPTDTRLVRLSDGVTRNIAPDLNWDSAGTFAADGLTFQLPTSGITATQGQSILFQPLNKAAGEMKELVHNPDDLAVSNAVSANISSSNTGTLQLSSLITTAFNTLPPSATPTSEPVNPVRISFDAAGQYTYSIYDSATQTWSAESTPVTFTSGTKIDISESTSPRTHGFSITLTGTPAAGDTMTISDATSLGDGFKLNAGNASAFLALRDATIFDNGTTLSDGFSAAMAVVGSRTQSAKYAAELSSTVATNLDADRTAVSGVNLDEEAARLLQYQQAYQASSKVIQIAQSLFDNVLNAVGR